MSDADLYSSISSTSFASSFNAVAAEYAAARPGYPPALFDAIEELAGLPLAGARSLDVGAGTGIATRLLRERGAHVTAAEPGPGMAAQLRAGLPGVPLVRANGDALPFAAGRFDLVTYAQAWHWTEPRHSVPEALRVLRPGGALALWWNVPDPRVPWLREQEERFTAINPERRRFNIPERAPAMIGELGLGLAASHREVRWSRTIPLATHLTHLATHSTLAVLPPERSRALVEAEAERLAALFPAGEVEEAYVVRLTVVPRTRD
ncbi:class I SAM-dependent methyltransferase [Streptomyces sp. 6N223]|uniref:class I SAM-dependent methyltransferase n=1 Tax=Streptomyces sp. 6N223 TaxID=3457412 RepID=UPI003FCF8DCB